jgi:hypothetical protein
VTDWVLDETDVVHHAYCSLIYCTQTPYKAAARDNLEMVDWLAREDVSNRHSAPSMLAPCEQCILGRPIEDVQ